MFVDASHPFFSLHDLFSQSPTAPHFLESTELRIVDLTKDSDAYPNRLWSSINSISGLFVKIVCTVKFIWSANDANGWKKPYPLQLIDQWAGRLGLNPGYDVCNTFPTFFGTFYHFDDPKIIKAVLEKFKGGLVPEEDELFVSGRSAQKLQTLLTELFPSDNISSENSLFAGCSKATSKKLHKHLTKRLTKENLKAFEPIIRGKAQCLLKEWADRCAQGERISIQEASNFTAAVIASVLCGIDTKDDAIDSISSGSNRKEDHGIAKAIEFINWYILQSSIRNLSKSENDDKKRYFDHLRKKINEIVTSNNAAICKPLPDEEELTIQEKKALILIVFFAGQESSGFLMSDLLYRFAKEQNLQQTAREHLQKSEQQNPEGVSIREVMSCSSSCSSSSANERPDIEEVKPIRKAIVESSSQSPSAYAVARRVRTDKDACLEYTYPGQKTKKMILPAGSTVSCRIIDAAHKVAAASPAFLGQEHGYEKWSAFGAGTHRCPGQQLAIDEVTIFFEECLRNYKLTTEDNGPLVVEGHITLQISKDYFPKIKIEPIMHQS